MANEETLEQLEEILEEAEATVEKREFKICLEIDKKKSQETVKDLGEAVNDMKKKFSSINNSIRKQLKGLLPSVSTICTGMKKELEAAFTITNSEEYAAAASRFGEGVAGALLTANESMQALEDSVVNTAAPVAGAVASMFNQVLPLVTNLVSNLNQTISDAITGAKPIVTWLWDEFLQPIAQWTGGVIIETMQSLAVGLTDISNWIQENMALVEGIALVIGSVAAAIGLVNAATMVANSVATIWNSIAAISAVVTSSFGVAMMTVNWPIVAITAALAALIAVVVLLVKNWDTVKGAAISVWETIKETFSNAWNWFKATVVDPLVNGFKGAANGIIGFVNGLIAGVVKGINSIIGVINKLHFTIPDWIPDLGGETFGFHLKTLNTPQIPYLAKGAVLPANKPFLAMVGDQRHGTNIEAPLATIQEAVAMVTADQTQAILAGFESSIGVQREILEAVLGICIGDDVIGNAVARYKRKQAVIRGGTL